MCSGCTATIPIVNINQLDTKHRSQSLDRFIVFPSRSVEGTTRIKTSFHSRFLFVVSRLEDISDALLVLNRFRDKLQFTFCQHERHKFYILPQAECTKFKTD